MTVGSTDGVDHPPCWRCSTPPSQLIYHYPAGTCQFGEPISRRRFSIDQGLRSEIEAADYSQAVAILLRLLGDRKGCEEDWIDGVDYAAQKVRDLGASS